MKTVMKVAVLLLSLNVYLFAQQPLISWRGVYLEIRDSINSRQLADTLGMNIIEFNSGRNSNSGVEDSVLKNGAELRVINQRKLFEGYTAGQHMEFQAERQSNPLFSHFENRIGVISQLDPAAWWCRPGIEPTGYMVQTAVPDSEYNYGQTNYQATFLIKLGVWSGTHPAVRCDVVCKTTGDPLASIILNSTDFVRSAFNGLATCMSEELKRRGLILEME